MQPDKETWFSERETETTTLTREQLIDEIGKVTNLDAPVLSKIFEIKYLLRHYFKIDPHEILEGKLGG